MKNSCILILLIMLCSCHKKENSITEKNLITGKWSLYSITGSLGVEETTIENSQMYAFDKNNTFKRITSKDENIEILMGTYTISNENEQFQKSETILKYVKLTYSSEVTFFNCTGEHNNKQLLLLNDKGALINQEESYCDGPLYTYKREN